ncbi:MAG: D-hexose-6-phosphate mutarotase [Thiomicrorhabdus sp.]|nr:D-hexose-6-phosphate mutarotase [Thiomicrorhabdus sp.]
MSSVSFDVQGALSIITVENAFAMAKITPYGACVLSFIPKKEKNRSDLLWVSPSAIYNGKKPVRGGIPICWPWFGKHSVDSTLPAHGFVRNRVWQLGRVNTLENGATELIFSIESSEETMKIWPYRFRLEVIMTIGDTLSLCLTTTNLSDQEMQLTEAFHSYFNVSHSGEVVVSGLENSLQVDTLSGVTKPFQAQKLFLSPPIDSVFLNHSSDAIIEDVGFSRCILIRKQDSMSTVVWNPGSEIVKGFSDIPNEAWPRFLCVESGNVFDDVINVKAGDVHRLKIRLQMV